MEPEGLPGSWQSVSAGALAAEFGVKPIWVVVPGAQRFNSMAQHMYGLRQPQAALRWLELAMAGDQRRHTPEFAAISSLHLATILHGLSRHLAALDVLEGTHALLTDRAVAAGGTHEDHQQLLLAVCLHNMGVAQLILGASEAAAASCVRAIETTRAYWRKTAQRRGRRPADSDELAVAAAQMEVTWLAVMRVAGGQRQQQPLQRSALRDSRRSLLLLASRQKRKCGDRASRLEDRRQRKTQSKEDRAQALVSANLRRIQHSTRGQDRRNG